MSNDAPLLCEMCELPASAYFETDAAIDDDTAENAQGYYCEIHSLKIQSRLEECRRAIMVSTHTQPDNVPNGMSLIRISNYTDTDEWEADFHDAFLVCTDCEEEALEHEAHH